SSGTQLGTAEALPSATPRRDGTVRTLWLSLALALILLVVAGGLLWRMSKTPAASQGLILTRLTSDAGLAAEPALSPDGKLLVYASDRGGAGNLDLWVQQVSGGEPIQLTRHEADDPQPSFSPDGTRIVFRSEREGGGIYVISALGGEARLLAPWGREARFSPDGNEVIFWTGQNSFIPWNDSKM